MLGFRDFVESGDQSKYSYTSEQKPPVPTNIKTNCNYIVNNHFYFTLISHYRHLYIFNNNSLLLTKNAVSEKNIYKIIFHAFIENKIERKISGAPIILIIFRQFNEKKDSPGEQ